MAIRFREPDTPFHYSPAAPCALCGIEPPITKVRYAIDSWSTISPFFKGKHRVFTQVMAELPFCEICQSKVKPFSWYLLLSFIGAVLFFLTIANLPTSGDQIEPWALRILSLLVVLVAYWKHISQDLAKRTRIKAWLEKYSNYHPDPATRAEY